MSEPSSYVPRPAENSSCRIPRLSGGLPIGFPAASSSAANAAARLPVRNRRLRGADGATEGDNGANVSDTKPFVLSCSSMPRAISAVVPPNAEIGGRSLSLSGSGSIGSLVLAALGRARRVRRPTLSPFRSFSSKLSRAAVSSASCAVASSAAFFRLAFASSAARLRFSSARFSSAAVLLSNWHFYSPPNTVRHQNDWTRKKNVPDKT